jgi:hypothetical protein
MGRGRTAIAIGLVIGGLSVAGLAQTAGASTPAGIPPRARATLLKDAREVARQEGDPHPHDIEAVRTTAGTAMQLECGGGCEGPESKEPVYMIAMRGHFLCNTCSHPRGGSISPGTVITLSYIAETMTRTGFGLSDNYPNLRAAGTPVRLDPKPPRRKHR